MKLKPKYDGFCRNKKKEEKENLPYVVRFKMPLSGNTIVNDMLHGKITFNNEELDDFIIQRSDGSPTYNLCVVVDDNFSEITHIIRGDDHLNNSPKQIKIYEALNFKFPKYAHIPMILDSEGKKISKTNNKFDLISFFKQGYLDHSMRNYLIRLGWSYKNQEIPSREERRKLFNLKKIQKSSAHNNFDKLNWLNRYYVKKLNETDLLSIYKDFLKYNNVKSDTLDCKLSKILNLQKHRFNNFYEIMNNSKLIPCLFFKFTRFILSN
jgi:glutamyl-tRNA synthetase